MKMKMKFKNMNKLKPDKMVMTIFDYFARIFVLVENK